MGSLIRTATNIASLISDEKANIATTYLPRITVADHESLRFLVDNFPTNSHEKWLHLQAKEIPNWKKNGWEVVLIDISADKFVRCCPEPGARPSFHTLSGIASARELENSIDVRPTTCR